MCGRARLATDPDELREAFELDEVPRMPAGYNMAPSQPLRFVASCKIASAPCERCTKGAASHVIGSNSARRIAMRKIVAGLFMSLDGVVESPGTWAFQRYLDAEQGQMISAGIV